MTEINPNDSFMQNIMALARAKGITARAIAGAAGIGAEKLTPRTLETNPYPSQHKMTPIQAEAAIALVAPDALETQQALRQLKGFPKPDPLITETLEQLFAAHPQDTALQAIKEIPFGSLFYANRNGKARGGKILRIADCVIPGIGTAALSCVERDESAPVQSKALSLIEKLGYTPDEAGLLQFCQETTAIIHADAQRLQHFQRALFVNLYPDGIMKIGKQGSSQRQQLQECMGCSPVTMLKYIYGEDVPNVIGAQRAALFFGHTTEEAFYAAAQTMSPGIFPPPPRQPLISVQQFGAMMRAVREELHIPQELLNAYLYRASTNRTISYIENGQRRTPLSNEEKARIANAFDCDTVEEFEIIAAQVQQAQALRNQYFGSSLQYLVDQGNATAQALLSGKDIASAHFTPQRTREALQQLGIAESELYQQAGVTADLQAVDQARSYMQRFDYAKMEPHETFTIHSHQIGRAR